jgi:hypothetical protein
VSRESWLLFIFPLPSKLESMANCACSFRTVGEGVSGASKGRNEGRNKARVRSSLAQFVSARHYRTSGQLLVLQLSGRQQAFCLQEDKIY